MQPAPRPDKTTSRLFDRKRNRRDGVPAPSSTEPIEQPRHGQANGSRPAVKPSRALLRRIELASTAGALGYVQALRGLFRGLHRAVMSDLRPFLPLYAGRRQDAKMGDLASRVWHFVAQVPAKVGRAFARMARALLKSNTEVMDELLGTVGGGSAAVIESAQKLSVRLVERAAQDYASNVHAILVAGQGQTPEALEAALESAGAVSEARAALIARDQTLKLNAALTRGRQEDAGFAHYWWLTVRDERVRPTHHENDGIIFTWSSPSPITGHPGHDPNCRCTPVPYDGPGAPGTLA